MTRLMTTRVILCMAVCVLPWTAAAQVAPPPPPPPPPPAPVPAPAPLPLPPLPAPMPTVIAAPTFEVWAVEDTVRMAREAAFHAPQAVDVEAIREAARSAADQARAAQEYVHLFDQDFHRYADLAHDFELQARTFSLAPQANGTYNSGLNYLSRNQYDRAITAFDRVIAQKGSRADASLHWKAFAQFRLGQTDEALATIAQLRKDYPQSRYLNDAKALEADVRKRAGQPIDPNAALDDQIKLLAIQGIQNADPERAIPLLEGVLNATNALPVKRNALYVLALSDQPRAREILLSYAKGAGNPDLQIEAIRYLTSNRNSKTSGDELRQIYESTQDVNVRMAIINAFRSSGNRGALAYIAGTRTAPITVRSSAIRGLSSIGGPQDLYGLYEKETSKDLKLQIVSALGSMQALEQLNQVIRLEKDPDVRRSAVRALGRMKTDQTGKMHADMYGTEQDVETRRAVIAALSAQNNAEALVAIARKEQSLELKRDIVKRLSDLAPKSKVAADFLMEIIK